MNVFLQNLLSDVFKKVVDSQNKTMISTVQLLVKTIEETCEKFFNNPATKRLLESDSKFDVVIVNWVLSEAILGISNHFNASVIAFSPLGGSPYVNFLIGNPAPYSYVPNVSSSFTDEMSFIERCINTALGLLGELMMNYWFLPNQKSLLEKHFPKAPPLDELLESVSLVLVNAHLSLETPRPYVTNMIPIGGFYVENVEENIPTELKELMDKSTEGIVYFSLGSNILSKNLPPEAISALLKSFAKLPYTVLWKFEDDNLPNKPDNLHISKWYPQKAILGKWNVKYRSLLL